MRTHNQTEVSRVRRCHMDYDQEDGCPMCIAERRAGAAEARAKRMEEALEKINHGCEQSYTIRVEQGYKDLWCPDRWPDGYRCGPCIARAALAPPPEGEVPK